MSRRNLERVVQVLVTLVILSLVVAILLPAGGPQINRYRTTPRAKASNCLRELALSMLQYHDLHHAFAAPWISAPDGRPLLSWRVSMLPCLEEQALFTEFHLDEPWNSPANLPLLRRM